MNIYLILKKLDSSSTCLLFAGSIQNKTRLMEEGKQKENK